MDFENLAARHRVSPEAVAHLAAALRRGRGAMAQFDHPDLGGQGQWMPGMTMVGDMFNTALKARVEALCAEMAGLWAEGRLGAERTWWPESLGEQPTMASESGGLRYAWFHGSRRLVVQRQGRTTVYDTGDHRIAGGSTHVGAGGEHLHLYSQHGEVRLEDLPVVGY